MRAIVRCFGDVVLLWPCRERGRDTETECAHSTVGVHQDAYNIEFERREVAVSVNLLVYK